MVVLIVLLALLLFAISLPLSSSFLKESLLVLVAPRVALLPLDFVLGSIRQPAAPRRFHQVCSGLLRDLFLVCQPEPSDLWKPVGSIAGDKEFEYTDLDGIKGRVVSVNEALEVLILEVAIPCPPVDLSA